MKTSPRCTANGQKLYRAALICEEWNPYLHLKDKAEIQQGTGFVLSCLHSPCGTAGQRAVAPAGSASAEPPASTGRASLEKWSPCCPTHTQAPKPAAGSSLWTSQSSCRCQCSSPQTVTAPPSTCQTTATTMLPWHRITTPIKRKRRLKRLMPICFMNLSQQMENHIIYM